MSDKLAGGRTGPLAGWVHEVGGLKRAGDPKKPLKQGKLIARSHSIPLIESLLEGDENR